MEKVQNMKKIQQAATDYTNRIAMDGLVTAFFCSRVTAKG